MSTVETSTGRLKKKGPPPIIKMDKGLKLAEQWVNNMTKTVEEPTQTEPEVRPYMVRLGLGAKVSRQMKRGPSDDPIERRLQAKLEAGRRKMARIAAELEPSAKTRGSSESDSEDESESKSMAFGKKKKTLLSASSLQVKK